jgi:hypothetical protein
MPLERQLALNFRLGLGRNWVFSISAAAKSRKYPAVGYPQRFAKLFASSIKDRSRTSSSCMAQA